MGIFDPSFPSIRDINAQRRAAIRARTDDLIEADGVGDRISVIVKVTSDEYSTIEEPSDITMYVVEDPVE